MARVDYDEIAPTYDRRYDAGDPEGAATALLEVVGRVRGGRVLEVGCGTGHWLGQLAAAARFACGLDLSAAMLEKARASGGGFGLVRGHANRLPFRDCSFDAVLCVNALHHFDDPRAFVGAARRLLRPRGALAVIGMMPQAGRDRWYLYDYFPGTYETDLRRYPSPGAVTDWMAAAGCASVEWRVATRIVDPHTGRAVLDDPILQKTGTSQLALLSAEAYAAGIARIEAALAAAAAAGETLVFPVDISLAIVTGWAPA
jgi:SAM-dependent methyltransferase